MTDHSLPKVTIITAWYNRAAYLQDTLAGLLAQTYPNFEIVLVNDGSPDPRVREILDSYEDPRLRVIHQGNSGMVQALRRAIYESDGAFIALQGAGDVSAPHRIALQADFLTRHPDYALIGCGFRSCRVGAEADAEPGKSHDNWDLEPGAPWPETGILARSPSNDELCRVNAFSHGEVMMRRSVYEELGGYRSFFANTQDLDLWLRMGAKHKLGVLQEFLYERRIFMGDGIAPDLKKSLRQLAFTRMALACYADRQKGQPDRVALYGPVAMRKLPMDRALFEDLLRCVKQVKAYGNLDLAELRAVRDLYGPLAYGLCTLYGRYLLARYGDKVPPKRRR
ncbi:MAG: glycosyltransferase [Mangrovicoccus sp.]|nr:glycosyltransferase [Mangrovicoccus sp.]